MKHTQEELLAIIEVPATEKAIDALIQSEITIYNDANGVAFKDINAIQKYTVDTGYAHYAFCVAILSWNVNVWETSRQLQIDIGLGNIPKPDNVDEFIALLPVFAIA